KGVIQYANECFHLQPELDSFLNGKISYTGYKQNDFDLALNRGGEALKKNRFQSDATNALTNIAKVLYQQKNDEQKAKEIYAKLRDLKGEDYEDDYQNYIGNLF